MIFVINEDIQVKYEGKCWVIKDKGGIIGWYATVESALGRAHDMYLGQKRVKGTLENIYEKYTKEFFSKIEIIQEEKDV